MYCLDPRNHKAAWWTTPGGFTHYDWRRRKIVPSATAPVHCARCHRHWHTTNRDLVGKLPTTRPVDIPG